jgi:hypothetical protein
MTGMKVLLPHELLEFLSEGDRFFAIADIDLGIRKFIDNTSNLIKRLSKSLNKKVKSRVKIRFRGF